MKLKLAEKFLSIQGEGHLTGKPMFFIRFAGCNVRSCPMHPTQANLCDTDWSMKAVLDQKGIEELAREARTMVGPHGWVSLTGGEPTDQMDALCYLVGELRALNLQVNIQTSGVRLIPCPWDWLTVSPKTSLDKLAQRFGQELKLVYDGQPDAEVRAWKDGTKFWNYYLMPLDRGGKRNTYDTINAVLRNGWELTTQAHKWWGVQ